MHRSAAQLAVALVASRERFGLMRQVKTVSGGCWHRERVPRVTVVGLGWWIGHRVEAGESWVDGCREPGILYC